MAIRKCPNCGEEIHGEGKLCPSCSFPVDYEIEENKYKASRPGKAYIELFLIFAAIAALFFWLSSIFGGFNGGLLLIILGAISAAVALWGLGLQIQAIKDYRLSQKDNEAFQMRMSEREKREQALRDDLEKQRAEREREEAEKREKLPVCPICGKKDNVRRISTLNRSASVAAWGIASAKIGKQYECIYCKHFF